MRSNLDQLQTLDTNLGKIEEWLHENKKQIEKDIQVNDKQLKNVLTEQLHIQSQVEDYRIEAEYLLKEFDDLCEKIKSESIDDLINNKNKDYSISEAKSVVGKNNDYVVMKKYYNRCYKAYSELKYLSELVTTRKYVLNNITNAVVNSVEDTIL